MRAITIAAVSAVLGMFATHGLVAMATAKTYKASHDDAVAAMSDAELDAYISALIDRQFADLIDRRQSSESAAIRTIAQRQ